MPTNINNAKATKDRIQRTVWTKKSYAHDDLYRNSVDVDVKTGAPSDYTSLFAAYHKLALDIAQKHKIPMQDLEDAVQNVNMRFYQKDGLNWYDPEKIFEGKDGKKYTSKFGSMYQSWLFLSMLAERDKYFKRVTKSIVVETDSLPDNIEPDISVEIENRDAAERWIEQAIEKLTPKYPELIPVLKLCAESAVLNKQVSRTEVAQAAQCNLRQASALLKRLREKLVEIGMGAETLEQ